MTLAAVAMLARSGIATRETPGACSDIYSQQHQMARFVRAEWSPRPVAVNDIGAVAVVGGAPVVDLWGLADTEVYRLRRAGRYDTAAVQRIVRDRSAGLAIVYGYALHDAGGTPSNWILVETWQTPGMTLRTGDTVEFYATAPEYEAELRVALQRYASSLPARVIRTVN
jgi:hypothetical protein